MISDWNGETLTSILFLHKIIATKNSGTKASTNYSM